MRNSAVKALDTLGTTALEGKRLEVSGLSETSAGQK